MRCSPPLVRVAASLLLLAALAALPGGCGAPKETGSARERDEQRAYGRAVVRSEVAPRRATLGDPVVWRVTATIPASSGQPLEVLLDSIPASLDVAARGEAAVRTSGDRVVWSRRYDVRGFDLGPLALPRARLPIRLTAVSGRALSDTLEFPFDSLAIDSLTPASTGAAEPDRGPIDPGLRPVDLALAGLIVAVIAALLLALVLAWRRRRALPAAANPAEPPESRYLRALESLRHDGPSLPRDSFHERLSDAVRRYVGEVTGIDAMDLTTRELERDLARSRRARPEAAAEIARILRRSDLVKFARRADAWEDASGLLEDAARLSGEVAIAEPDTPPPAPPPAAPTPTTADPPPAGQGEA